MERINRIRERINLRLYKSKINALAFLKWGSGIIATLTILALIYYHGFPINPQERFWITLLVKFSIGFYIVKYIIEFIYSFTPIQHLRETKWEGLLMLFLVIDIISINLFGVELMSSIGSLLGMNRLREFLILFIQGYFLLIIFLEVGKASTLLPVSSLSPPTLLTFSFVILISMGSLLLMLPEMTVTGESMPFLDALFTSISASCVTGLIVVDTATYFSFKGQLLIMFLIQLGGLNIISFASAFAFFTKKGIGIRHQSLIQASYSTESLTSSSQLFKQIFRFTLLAEGIGTLLLFISWGREMVFSTMEDRFFFSLFHTISAFNNAGFALFTEGLYQAPVRSAYLLHIWIALLIILGGLGFTTIRDVFSIARLRERFRKPWIHLQIGTKISLYATAFLIPAGILIFWLVERNGVLEGMNVWEMAVTSFFQSVTTRTAGFNTVDFSTLGMPVLIFFMFLMFVGGSTGSTAGGIKTSTFTLVLLSAYSTIRGKKNLEVFRQRIPWDLLNRAFSVFLFSASFILGGIFLLTITDPQLELRQLAFEEVSAFCTVGLSTGITADLSTAGRIIIMASMFIGRIGTLTLAFALAKQKESSNYKYPKANLMVG